MEAEGCINVIGLEFCGFYGVNRAIFRIFFAVILGDDVTRYEHPIFGNLLPLPCPDIF